MSNDREAPLAPPFDRLFATKDAAHAFGTLARFTLECLGVEGDDPLVTLSLRKRRLHLTYGQWLVLGVRAKAQNVRVVSLVLLDEARSSFPEALPDEPFVDKDVTRPRVYLSQIVLEEVEAALRDDPELLLGPFRSALRVVHDRFKTWAGSPYRGAHRQDLLSAAHDGDAWRQMLAHGAVLSPASGGWWANDLTDLHDGETSRVLWVPSRDIESPTVDMEQITQDDVIVLQRAGAIEALGHVTSEPERRATRPNNDIEEPGIVLTIELNAVTPPFPVGELTLAIRQGGGPFDAQGALRPGPLWPISAHQAKALHGLLQPRLPSSAIEELEDVADVNAGATVAERLADPDVRVVKIAPGAGAQYWDECLTGGFIAIGWEELGDLRRFRERGDLIEAFADTFPDSGITPAQHKKAGEIWTFRELRPGDVVLANHGKSAVLALGVVQEPGYEWWPDRPHQNHVVPVAWEPRYARSVTTQGGWGVSTVLELDRATIDEWFPTPLDQSPARHRHHPVPAIAEATGIPVGVLQRWLRAIERKGQAVLYGPPGTGKTFVAEHLARHLVGGGDGLLEVVQFHPAYGYEDFIQGLRPTVAEGSGVLSFELRPGRFLDFVQRAEQQQDTSVLIIDEINRANLPRVLGELMYLLEYRGRTVPLAAGGTLRVPESVRILATMNTADRSIALVDHALRRRFAFLAVRPHLEVLIAFHAGKPGAPLVPGLTAVLTKLHSAIDDPHLHLGISYFLVDDLMTDLEDIWRTEIEPYLEELFFDQPRVRDEFRWAAVRAEVMGGG